MAQTATNIAAREQLYRAGFTPAVVVVICNLPLGLTLFELLKVLSRPLALLALLFIAVAATIEAVNVFNYMTPLFTLTLPEYTSAFRPDQLQALARGANRLFGYGFSVSLTFFGVFCALTGYLIFRSRFLPAIIGVLMVAAGVYYWINSFVLFLALPQPPDLLRWVTLIAELSLALWLLIVGVNEAQWRAQVQALQSGGAQR